MNWGRRKRLLREVDRYSDRLASEETVSADEAAGCHAAKLILETDAERRIRSIQTLAMLNPEAALAPALREIVQIANRWPSPGAGSYVWLLADCVGGMVRRSPTVDN